MMKQEADSIVRRFMDNLFVVIKSKDLMVSIVEENSGVSIGYLSRLRKGERMQGFTLQKGLMLADAVGEKFYDLLTGDYADVLIDRKIEDLEKRIQELREQKKSRNG